MRALQSQRIGQGFVLVVAFVFLLAPTLVGDYGLRLLNVALLAGIAVLGLNFAMGYAGLISLMHGSTVGMGAYAMALLTVKAGWNPWLASLASVAASAFFSYLAGVLLLRLKGHYFALATLGINVSFGIVASNWVDLTGGTNGISMIPSLSVMGFALEGERRYFYFVLTVLTLLTAISYVIRKSDVGRAMIAVRDDELAAAVSGLNVTKVRVTALTLSGALAGVSGALFASHVHFVSPEDFTFTRSIIYLAMLVVGGEGSIFGALLGALVVSLLPELLRDVGEAYLLVFGLLTLIVLIVFPKGLAGLISNFLPSVGARSDQPKSNKRARHVKEGA